MPGPLKGSFLLKGNHLFSGKPRLVRYSNLPRSSVKISKPPSKYSGMTYPRICFGTCSSCGRKIFAAMRPVLQHQVRVELDVVLVRLVSRKICWQEMWTFWSFFKILMHPQKLTWNRRNDSLQQESSFPGAHF